MEVSQDWGLSSIYKVVRKLVSQGSKNINQDSIHRKHFYFPKDVL